LNTLPGIDVATGTYDLRGNAPMLTAITERQGLQNAGVPFRRVSVDGGHTWQFWRLVLRDFLANTVFNATTTSATLAGNTLTASVVPMTARLISSQSRMADPQPRTDRRFVMFAYVRLGAPARRDHD
jgi:hypothetical protein